MLRYHGQSVSVYQKLIEKEKIFTLNTSDKGIYALTREKN